MRCSNCGWENPAGTSRCTKCNAQLQGNAGPSGQGGHYGSSSSGSNQPLRATVREEEVFGSKPIEKRPTTGSCPKCGYPVGRMMTTCPRCGHNISGAGHKPQEAPYSGAGSAQNKGGTVNPWAKPQNASFCTLTPIPWEGENVEEYQPIKYSGDSIVLSRANTDPNNNTITSKTQAEIIYDNGAWWIVDRSAQQTTYVHAGRKSKIEDGDIIILGNRRFVFKG
ncbi:MAG TPA: zinc ribbon domain-containing protein [Candidatus Coprenecus pullistercoris]|nr:zinc ribbon domain-containing protein [Candidatus Coprenecus pullistercoris]